MSRSLVRLLALAACSAAALVAGPAAPAHACTPHVESSGPTVTVSPDYQHPASSDVSYDSSALSARVITCL